MAENWNEIVTAWAKWVNGEGLGVQGKECGKWIDWDTRSWINRNAFSEWRIKRSRTFARLVNTPGGVAHCTRREGEPDPVFTNAQWIGEWQEVPRDD
jgi:hypothetical protein